ncbi:hypothetical protein LC613_20910 [Nostoc sphaeroides CHAB 2801]|uniref:hypothetical protein n=1 Tax=Nostoc sphaeroides TaxID=446679 RepID=UPI001E649DD6|nr:hypothetical protein [Nostoc sphaeroides]MCC5630335.1 hypothetical protein [Nostoc sphaeroides CHAB 2801]
MEESAVNPINSGFNPLSADGVSNLYSGSSFAANGSLSPETSLLTGGSNLLLGNGNNSIPGGGINPFAGDGGSGLQKLIFDRLKLVLGDNFFKDINSTLAGGSNPFAGGSNPFAGGSNPFAGGSNPIAGGASNPFAGGGNPIAGGASNPFAGGGNPISQVLEVCFNNRLSIR